MAQRTAVGAVRMAFALIGEQVSIQDLDDGSSNAELVDTFLDIAIEKLLSDYDWTHARKHASLSLHSEDPNSKWDYAYALPSDLVAIRTIPDPANPKNKELACELGAIGDVRVLYSDEDEVNIFYTYKNERLNMYSPNAYLALGCLLGHFVAPALAEGDNASVRLLELYERYGAQGAATDANQETNDTEEEVSWVTAR